MNSLIFNRRQALFLAAGAAVTPFMTTEALASSTTLRAGITGFSVINTLDPAKHSLLSESYVLWGIFNSLVKFDENMKIVPDLAVSFEFIDPTTLEFKLRKGVKFHDGNEMTSEDVKFSLERVIDEKVGSPNRVKLSSISHIEAIDPYTVRIITKKPFAPLLTYLTNSRTGTQIVSKKAVEAAGDKFGSNPIGTGAYKLKDWRTGSLVELEAFPEYFDGAPAIANINLPLIAEESSGLTALQGGQIDLTATAPFAAIPKIENDKSIKVYKQPGLNVRYVSLNTTKAPFDDVHFRRALAMAFDRNAMIRSVVFGEGVVPAGLLPPALTQAGEAVPELLTFNPEAAKAELAKSKYPADTEVKLLIWGPAWWKKIGEFFAMQANAVLGTKIQLEAGETNAVFSRQRAGDYQAAIWGWLGLIDADEYLGDILGTDGSRNFHRYSNPELDKLLEQGRAELDPAKRQDIYRKADLLSLDDAAVIPCFCSNIHNLSVPNLQGFTQLPYSNFGDQFGKLKFG